jgi:hypothetical protein
MDYWLSAPNAQAAVVKRTLSGSVKQRRIETMQAFRVIDSMNDFAQLEEVELSLLRGSSMEEISPR